MINYYRLSRADDILDLLEMKVRRLVMRWFCVQYDNNSFIALAGSCLFSQRSTVLLPLSRLLRFWLVYLTLLLVFTYHVIKPKNRNHSINKVTNKGYDR